MTIFWPALIVGLVLLIAGIAVVVNAARIASFVGTQQKNVASDEFTTKSATSKNARLAGIGFMLVGALGVVLSFLGLNW